jgi:hypothetical protein
MSDSQSPADLPDRLNLGATDFDAYLPERVSSDAVGKVRLAIKQRLLAWAKSVASRLESFGITAAISGSDEFPSERNGGRVDNQRVYFSRDAQARERLEGLLEQGRQLTTALGADAHRMHAYLALKIDAHAVEVSIEVHPEAWVDFRNVRARLLSADQALELTSALESLPEQYALKVTNDVTFSLGGIDTNCLRHALDQAEATGAPLWIGWSVPRDTAVEHTALLEEQLEDAIVALAPVYRLIAWAPDNDCVELDREWTLARAAKAKAHEEAEREQAAWEAKKAADDRREAERRAPRRDRAARRASAPPESCSEPKPEAEVLPMPVLRPTLPRVGRRLTPARVVDVDPHGVVDRGVKVQVLSGAFEGKLGTVQELDGRGGARVLLGLLAVRVDVSDLGVVRESRERPTLASSHRRPSSPRQQ